jgi:selenocysteine lyase/cysteine desulfurase
VTIDVGRVRADTPGSAAVVHLNNAGASLPPRVVVDTVVEHLELEARVGGYAAADEVAARSDAVYDSVAALLGAHRDEIALVENATRAWDMAFYALAPQFVAGDRILLSRAEYASNAIAAIQVATRIGVVVEVIPDDEHGQVSVDALRAMLACGGVGAVAVSWIPTQGGLVNPAAAIGAATREFEVPFLLDACQAAGQLPIDVEVIGCDFLSATGRKYVRGPRGTGFLYVNRSRIAHVEPPFLDVHAARWTADGTIEPRDDARVFESWEHSVANRLGLGAAIDYALALGVDQIAARVLTLGAALRAQLADVPGTTLHDLGETKCGIVTFTVDGVSPSDLAASLRGQHINISVSTIDFARFDFGHRGLDSVARASVHYYNTDEELSRFVAAVAASARPRGR